MKTDFKAIITSVIVIALALTAVSGVTYSWFSDTENADITVSTAKINIIGEYVAYDADDDANIIKTSKPEYSGDLVTDASISSDKKDLKIRDMLADRTVTATYKVTNDSTVDVLYRMYISVDGITDGLATDSIRVTANTGNPLTVSMTPFTNGIAYVVGTATTGQEMTSSAPDNTYTFTLTISFDKAITSSEDFSVRIVNEAYQRGYSYTEAQAIVNGQTSMPTTPVSNDVTFKGVAVGENATVEDSEIEVVFSSAAANVATNNGANSVTFRTTMLEPGGSVAKIDLKLDGAAQTNFGTDNWVTVTITIPGPYTDLKVYYNGSESEQPEILSVTNDGSDTKVTFRTNHFSEFEILKNEISVNDEAGLKKALLAGIERINVSAPFNISNTLEITNDCSIDLCGNTISATDVTPVFEIKCDVSFSNGTISNEKSGGRVLNVADVNGVDVCLDQVNIIGPTTGAYTRGISFYNTENSSLTANGGSISASYYAINIASDCPNFVLNASNSNVSAGWCAYQTWSENTKATFTGCILQGTNDKSYNAEGWNNFATIVYNTHPESSDSQYKGLSSTELNLNNCTIKSIVVPDAEGNANKQYYMSIRSPGATINVDDCTFVYTDGAGTNSYSDLLNTENALNEVLSNVSIYTEALDPTGPTVTIDGQSIEISV